MKQNSFFILAACMIAGMSACTHEEAVVNPLSIDNVIRVTTGVTSNASATVATRAGYETSNLKEFAFFVNNPVSDLFTYNNIRMVKAESGEWKAPINTDMYWMSRLQPVTVIAYAPYQEEGYNISSEIAANVLADQSDEESIIASDFIGMKMSNFVPKTGEGGNLTDDGLVPISMQHLMSKIKISIEYPGKLNSSDNTNPITDIRIDGAKLKGVCNLGIWQENDAASAVIPVNSNPETVIPFSENFSQDAEGGIAAYECILIPQIIGVISIQFTIGEVPYSWTWEDLTLNAGTMHKIDLKIVGRKVELSTNVSVNDWLEDATDITEGLDMKNN